MLQMLLEYAVLLVSVALSLHGGLTLYLMLYTWWRPERLSATRGPARFEAPGLRFTALLPARHEQEGRGRHARAGTLHDREAPEWTS